MRQQALIFYNEDDRDGAEEEADNLSQSLIITGCDVIKQVWSEVLQLRSMITDHLLQTRHTSSVLILCLMSHGSMGCLKGSDGKVSINNILKQVCDIIPQHIPLVSESNIVLVARARCLVMWRNQRTSTSTELLVVFFCCEITI